MPDANTLHVRPAPGLDVLDPITFAKLPPEGAVVPADSYWFRRLHAGDVSLVQTVPEAAAAPALNTPRSKA